MIYVVISYGKDQRCHIYLNNIVYDVHQNSMQILMKYKTAGSTIYDNLVHLL